MTAVNKTNPYLVTRRILDGKSLWGAVLQFRGKKFKIEKEALINLADTSMVLVDFAGGDIPVSLTTMIVNGKKVLRTIRDGVIRNNFNKVKPVKLISCNKLRIKK
jgi:hypothetical protein